MRLVIPPRNDCKEPRHYDQARYILRHLVGTAFFFKQCRAVPTRNAKNEAWFLAI